MTTPMNFKTAKFINVNGKLLDLNVPRVMGILNVTPDSFYEQSRTMDWRDLVRRIRQMLHDGADIIDVGGCSTRSGADDVSPEEEKGRLERALEAIRYVSADAVVSVDTYRAQVARWCVEKYGVAIINDISGGTLDADMFDVVAHTGVPYILTHIKGSPRTMQRCPTYKDVVREVNLFFSKRVEELRERGVKDIILDPGFGFGKSESHNYQLLKSLDNFRLHGLPLLVGVSRKSMIHHVLGVKPDQALNGTTVVNTICLMKGANILRVHDVRPAVEAVKIIQQMKKEEEACFSSSH